MPRVPANLVSRDGLRGALAGLSAELPVTLVCAPAGYGKTLLLADWIEHTGAADKAWVSLDREDNDAGRFWTAVLSAVCACAAVPAASRLRTLHPPGEPDAAGFYAEVIDGFAALPAPLHLVLDDLQEVQSEQTWHGLATLVRHQPAAVRLVLSTRADPPLPLARLRVQGELAELRASELRFDHDEALELLRRAGLDLDSDQVRRLVAQTDGWPAGLRLAARSLREVPDREAFLAEFAGNDRAIADFLVSEVLARLPAETIDVLALVSVCDEVTPALAVALSGRAGAGAILAGLERDGSLVLGVGPERQWYRMHPLLRSYLRADLTRHRPNVVARLHETAAAWFAAQEQPGKAFDHALDHVTHTENRALVDLLHRHAVTVLLAGDGNRSVRRALAAVGPAAVTGSPALALISALAHVVAGDRGLAEADLASCWTTWPATPNADLRRLRRLVVTTHALAGGTAPAAQPHDWPDVLDAYEGTDLEAWARLGLGWTMLCAGEPARPELEAAERLARTNGLDFLRLHCLSALAVLSARDGAFPAMESSAAAAVELAYALGWTSSPWLSTNHLMIGFARLLCLDPAAALDEARHAAAALAADAPSLPRYLVGVLSGAACVDEGRRPEGLALLRAARHEHGDASVPEPLLAAGALIEHRSTVDAGQGALAQRLAAWLRERAGDVAEVGLMQARASFAHGGLEATEELLADRRSALCPTTPLEAELLKTALEIRLGRRTRARDTLYQALVRAEPMSLIRPFHDADPSVRRLLLEQVGGFGSTNGFAARVGQAMSTVDVQRTDVLTSREHAVLVRLSSPQSLDELAVDLRVSVNTVKTHVRAIYAKLGVNNRRGAVVAGRQLGLT